MKGNKIANVTFSEVIFFFFFFLLLLKVIKTENSIYLLTRFDEQKKKKKNEIKRVIRVPLLINSNQQVTCDVSC